MTTQERSRTLPLDKRTVVKVKVNGVEKRYKPTRHYVYILQVRWSDYSEYVVYRKYTDFYTFHCALLEKFPIEAGAIHENARTIPFLPGRMWFSRSEVYKVATRRQAELANYCQELLTLPPKISQCMDILDFFEAHFDDINPIKDATMKPPRSRLILALLPFLGRDKDAQDFDNSGLGGSSENLQISDPITLETYLVVADYDATEKSEVTLKEGDVIEVLEKNDNGWWFVQKEKHHGWAPASYLDPISHPVEIDEPDPNYTGDLEKYITTNAYKGQYDDELSFEKDIIVEVMHKLLDGWWIVSYNGDAGYAPAAFLAPYVNPHLLRSVTFTKPKVKCIARRSCWCSRTIKTASGKLKNISSRDLSLYRKYSQKRKAERPNRNQPPPPPKPPRKQDDNQDVTYENSSTDPEYQNSVDAAGLDPSYLAMNASPAEHDLYENIVTKTGRDSQVPPVLPPRQGENSDNKNSDHSNVQSDVTDTATEPFYTVPVRRQPLTDRGDDSRPSSSSSLSPSSSPHRVSLNEDQPTYRAIPALDASGVDEDDYATVEDDCIVLKHNNVEITLSRSTLSSPRDSLAGDAEGVAVGSQQDKSSDLRTMSDSSYGSLGSHTSHSSHSSHSTSTRSESPRGGAETPEHEAEGGAMCTRL